MRKLYFLGILLVIGCLRADAQGLADVLFAGQDPKCDYMGQLHDNGKERNGCGIVRGKNGTVYVGDVWRGKHSGLGLQAVGLKGKISNCPGAAFYVGDWFNNKKEGRGRCYSADGDLIYDGEFSGDKPLDTYPSREPDMSRYVSDITLPNGEYFFGELRGGQPDGYGFYVIENFGIAVVNTRNGHRKGSGLVLTGPDDWAAVNWTDNNGFDVITDSRSNQRRTELLNKNLSELKKGLSDAFIQTATAVTETAISAFASSKGSSSDVSYASSGTGSYTAASAGGSSGKKNGGASAKGAKKADCGTAWMNASRVYADYDSQLAADGARSADISERRSIQQKMRAIRQKWEARGCPITKSSREDN